MASESAENYLKAIHTLARESPTREAAMSRIAVLAGVTTGSATTMVKKLAAARLVRYERFGGVSLTSAGEKAAVDIIRRHRLVETFLVRTLKLDWSIVHDEAERLEHAISPVVLEALDRWLGRPEVDPHGDPIPDAGGRVPQPTGAPLSRCEPGASARVMRIADQQQSFLLFVARHGLTPGARVKVLAVDSAAQSITVQADGAAVTLGLSAAGKIMMAPVPKRVRRTR